MLEIRDYVRSVFIIVLIGFCLYMAFNNQAKDERKKEIYDVEIYHDEDTGITYSILKDGLGDVIYCEPLEVEVKANESKN